jgi:multisubunit Na+/H+ antiporter MnhE subunit
MREQPREDGSQRYRVPDGARTTPDDGSRGEGIAELGSVHLTRLGLHAAAGGDTGNVPKRTSLVQRGLQHAPSFAAFWVMSMLLWLLFTSTVALSEVGVGMCASLVGAFAGEAVRARGALRFGFRLRWIRRTWRIPVQVALDMLLVFAALVRHATGRKPVRGRWVAVPFEPGGDDPVDHTRRGLAEAAVSVSPNSVAVGVDEEEGVLLVHQLVADPTAVERLVRRGGGT